MNTVPTMISTKDLDYIKDMFNWHFTACKQALHYSNEATNQEVKDMLADVAKNHNKHCQQLLNILK